MLQSGVGELKRLIILVGIGADDDGIARQNVNGNDYIFIIVKNIILCQILAFAEKFHNHFFATFSPFVEDAFISLVPFQRQAINYSAAWIE